MTRGAGKYRQAWSLTAVAATIGVLSGVLAFILDGELRVWLGATSLASLVTAAFCVSAIESASSTSPPFDLETPPEGLPVPQSEVSLIYDPGTVPPLVPSRHGQAAWLAARRGVKMDVFASFAEAMKLAPSAEGVLGDDLLVWPFEEIGSYEATPRGSTVFARMGGRWCALLLLLKRHRSLSERFGAADQPDGF